MHHKPTLTLASVVAVCINLLLLSSCGSTGNVYHSNNVAQPMFDGKYQASFDGGIGPGPVKNNYVLSGAVSVTNHWLVAASTVSYKNTEWDGLTFSVRDGITSVKNTDVAIGYYSIYEKVTGRSGTKYAGFDVQAGYGWGNGRNQTDPRIPNVIDLTSKSRYINQGSFKRIFVQPSVYWKYNAFQFGIAVKTSYLQMTQYKSIEDTLMGDGTTYYYNSGYVRVGSYTSNNDGFIVVEPACTMRVGFKWVFIYLQTTGTIAAQIHEGGTHIDCTNCGAYAFNPLNIKLGVTLQLDALNPLRRK